MRNKFIIIILFIFLYEFPLFAQYKYTFSQFGDETVDFIKQPLKWDGSDYLKFGLISLAGGLTMFADEPIRDAVRDNHKYSMSAPMEFGRMYGELYSPIIFFSGFAAYSLITNDIKTRKIAYEIGQASLYAGAINYALKFAIGRGRPNLNSSTIGAGFYKPFYSPFKEEYHSMPGGHSTAAFVISTVLSRNVNPVWLKILVYAPALLTMTSRVYQGFHWTSDNIIGAAFGYFIGTWVVDKHEKTDKSGNKGTQKTFLQHFQIQPVISGDNYGINLSVPFL